MLPILLAHDVQIFLAGDSSGSDTGGDQLPSLNLHVAEWRFFAEKARGTTKNRQYAQNLEATIHYQLLDTADRVVTAGSLQSRGSRTFRTRTELETAQIAQPAYAQAVYMFSEKGNNLLTTLLLAAATGVTILLIYSLRSQ